MLNRILMTSLFIAMPNLAFAETFEFVVHPPKDTPKDARVFASGDHAALGGWQADGLELKRDKDGLYRGRFEADRGARLEFKFTLGSWQTVEKNADGGEIANRSIIVGEGGVDDEGRKYEFRVAKWAAAPEAGHVATVGRGAVKTSRTGDIRLHEKFHSKSLDNDRTLIVYLPSGYEAAKEERYPVLYMHDGQNLFDAATSFIGVEWQADETAGRLIAAKKIRPIIIVGIYNNAERTQEYTPTRDENRKAGGRGGAYMDFVVKEVKPFIDKTYRTWPGREETGVAGSSLGGLISLHMAMEHADVFSKCGVISPALFWDDHHVLREIEKRGESLDNTQIWLDMGTKEGSTLPQFDRALKDTRRLAKLLKKNGLREGEDFKYVEVEGAVHNEGAWAERFGEVLVFLYGVEE